MLDAMHGALLREHGGAPGVRDERLLDSALARARHRFAYAKGADLAACAAAYAFGLAKNHGYVDGNKRVAFMAAYVFLGLNDHDLDAEEPDVALTMEQLAGGELSESALARWFRERIRPIEG